jgi:hypothetical protein
MLLRAARLEGREGEVMPAYIKITEEQFLAQVIEAAHLFGWSVAHFRPAMTATGWRTPVAGDGKGFPDLVLAKDGNVIFAELKADGKKPTPEQQNWIKRVHASVWYPSDLDMIIEILRME